jgi:hypothetical protein
MPFGDPEMRQVEIFDPDYQRLQDIAVPFVDTPATVIARLLDEHIRTSGAAGEAATASTSGTDALVFGPESVPPLTHTKVMSAIFDQQAAHKPTWDSLVRAALIRTKRSYATVEELRRVSGANIVAGFKDDEGYKPLDGHGFSFQGVSAEDAIKVVLRCARALRCPFSVEFVWRDKEGAHRPGRRGLIQYSPT